MTTQFNERDAARFLRTLRVATYTALAQDDLQRGRGLGRPGAAFQALAAKGPGEWRFPDAGLMSSDGLVLAKLSRQPEGAHVDGAAGAGPYRPFGLRQPRRPGSFRRRPRAPTACSIATVGCIWCSRKRRSMKPICRRSSFNCWTARCDRSRVRASWSARTANRRKCSRRSPGKSRQTRIPPGCCLKFPNFSTSAFTGSDRPSARR